MPFNPLHPLQHTSTHTHICAQFYTHIQTPPTFSFSYPHTHTTIQPATHPNLIQTLKKKGPSLKKKRTKTHFWCSDVTVLLSSICSMPLDFQPCSVICMLLIIHGKHRLCTMYRMLRVMGMLWYFYHGLSGALSKSNQYRSDKQSVHFHNSIGCHHCLRWTLTNPLCSVCYSWANRDT